MGDRSNYRLIARTDQTLVYLNTLLLLVIAFIPFTTSLILEYGEDGAGRAAMLVHGATVTLLTVAYALL